MRALVFVTDVPQSGIISQLIVHFNASGTGYVIDNGLGNTPAEFVLLDQFTGSSSGPIEIAFEDVQRYWVFQTVTLQDDFSVCTILQKNGRYRNKNPDLQNYLLGDPIPWTEFSFTCRMDSIVLSLLSAQKRTWFIE